MRRPNNPSNNQEILMKSLIHISAGLFLSATLVASASANDHKILGVVAMPRNETNDLTLKLPICRVIKRIQLTADRGDVQLSGVTVYFKVSNSTSQSLSVPSTIKKGKRPAGLILIATTTTNAALKKSLFLVTPLTLPIWPR